MIRLYTKGYSAEALGRVPDKEAALTGEQHAALSEAEFGKRFESRAALTGWYLSENSAKLPALDFLAGHLRAAGCRHVLSLGAGPCVLESELSRKTEARVTAADFDGFFIENARRLFPEIGAEKFDFMREDAAVLLRRLAPPVDAAAFFGSSYVMDDAMFVRVLSALRAGGLSRVFDFQGGFLDWRRRLAQLNPLRWVKSLRVVRRAFASRTGQFHGYARGRGELRRIYRESGFRLAGETAVGGYRYVAVLEI